MDRLEEHIRNNREDLDRHDPSSDIWRRIDKSLNREKTHLPKWFSIAAMLIVILGSILFLYQDRNNTTWMKGGRNIESQQELSNPQLKETEIYYNNLVNSLYQEATPLLVSNPEIKKELNTDISHLDSLCTEIRKDLKDNVANQEVVEALILNYRIKIRLLEDMLVILKENEGKPEKNESHEL
jgi:hypothetical protein